MRGPFVILTAALLGLMLSSCALGRFLGGSEPAFDPLTAQHLSTIRTVPSLPPDSCAQYVAYEQIKLTSKDAMADKKSLANVGKACDCVQQAGSDTSSVVRKSCTASILGYEAYEAAKQSK